MQKQVLAWLGLVVVGSLAASCAPAGKTVDTGTGGAGATGSGGVGATGSGGAGPAGRGGSGPAGSGGAGPTGTGGAGATGSGGAGAAGKGGAGATGGTSGAGTAGTGGSGPGAAGDNGTAGSGSGGDAGGAGGTSLGGHGGAAQGGTMGTAGAGGSAAGAAGGAPHVTPQNATSVPAMYGNTVANGGKLTPQMYPTYYYSPSATGDASSVFKSTPKQSTPVMKPCNVYTPPSYDPQTKYPYIVILHGYTDNQDTWNQRSNPNVVKLFDNLITSKVTNPFIAVFAKGTANDTNTTGGYYLFGDELMNDLVPFMEANYSVKKDRGSRALAGFSFGGMQTLLIGVCAHLKDFAWFGALDPAGPGTPSADDIAKYVGMENAQAYPLYYLHISVGKGDTTAGSSAAAAANGLTTKGQYITSANFSFQNGIGGQSVPDGYHDYPTAEVGLYNLLRMAFAPTN